MIDPINVTKCLEPGDNVWIRDRGMVGVRTPKGNEPEASNEGETDKRGDVYSYRHLPKGEAIQANDRLLERRRYQISRRMCEVF